MQNAESMNCVKCDGTGFLDYRGFSMDACCWCGGTGTVKDSLTVEPVSKTYEFKDGDVHLCWACGALPCDGGLAAWGRLPWIVTLRQSAGRRFLIDRRDPENPDMFSGLLITGDGRVFRSGSTTGETGRRNLHRSYFEEDLPA